LANPDYTHLEQAFTDDYTRDDFRRDFLRIEQANEEFLASLSASEFEDFKAFLNSPTELCKVPIPSGMPFGLALFVADGLQHMMERESDKRKRMQAMVEILWRNSPRA
jgi:hypothetical protein